jgi:hypothetical protein
VPTRNNHSALAASTSSTSSGASAVTVEADEIWTLDMEPRGLGDAAVSAVIDISGAFAATRSCDDTSTPVTRSLSSSCA